uniref:UNC93-like protein MFSD11 n=1 Tax=Pristiophorus japonicus TaxID=55135 RepID=UPI00398E6D51
MDRRLSNVYLLGMGFMLIFTAFTTCGNIEQTVIRSLTNTSFSGSGYNSLAIVYGVFSASNLIAPSVVAVVGPKLSMVVSGLVYSREPVSLSLLIVVNYFSGSMLRLFRTKNILLLSVTIVYSGLVLTFYSGVYGTCIGATRQFGTAAKGLIGLSGIFVGVGEILGGGIFGLLCINNQFRRTSAVLLGLIAHFLGFYLIFLIIPADAPLMSTAGSRYDPYLAPSPPAALVSSFLLGLGDSCFNTQLYSILGTLYPEQGGPAFGIFKFTQSVSAAVAFGYSNYLLLSWQLLILTAFCFFGTLTFFIVERIEDNASSLRDF